VSPTVVCVGHAALDHVYCIDAFPVAPTKVRAQAFTIAGGGIAANAACAIARLGGRALFCGPVGDDEFGRQVSMGLAAAGVDARFCASVPGTRTSHSAVIVDAIGERLIVNHRGSALEAPASLLPLDRIDAAAILVDPRWRHGATAILDWARARNIPTVLDAEVGDHDAVMLLVPKAAHVVFSEPGFAQWAGRPIDAPGAVLQLRELIDAGATLAAVTLGPRGGCYATRDGLRTFAAFPVAAVETLAAGDVFHGAYTLALAERMPIESALRFAAVAAALKCARSGGRAGMPTRAQVVSAMASVEAP